MTGTLTYAEPHQLSGDAFAVVALVKGSARATENSIVASQIDRDITAVPYSFSLDIGSATIDPNVTYTIQATIVDGEHAWITGHGVPVLTKGNPKDVDIRLTYRPDLLKGAVTGQITGVGIDLSPTSYAMAILIDPTSGETLGIDAQNVVDGLPVAFSVPYAITDIQPTQDYVVTAEVGDDGQTWRNAAGVPVITNGNPKTAIQVVVTPVVVASPSPSASPSPTPIPSVSPAPEPSRPGSGNLLGIIILIAIILAIVAFFIARGRSETPPPAGAAAAAGGTEGAAEEGAAAADTAAEAEAEAGAEAEAVPPEPDPPGKTPA